MTGVKAKTAPGALRTISTVLLLGLPPVAVASRLAAPGWMLIMAVYTVVVPIGLFTLYGFTIRTIARNARVANPYRPATRDLSGIVGSLGLFLLILCFPESDDQSDFLGFHIAPFNYSTPEWTKVVFQLSLALFFVLALAGYTLWFNYSRGRVEGQPPPPARGGNRLLAAAIAVELALGLFNTVGISVTTERVRQADRPEAVASGFEDKSYSRFKDHWVDETTQLADELADRFGLEVFAEPTATNSFDSVCGSAAGHKEDGSYTGAIGLHTVLSPALPENDWDEAVAIVAAWGAPRGFTDVDLERDKEDLFEGLILRIDNPINGGRIIMALHEKTLSIDIDTPCTRMKSWKTG